MTILPSCERFHSIPRQAALLSIGLVVLLAGCGKPSAQISGNVTNSGQPVGEAEVVIESLSDASAKFFGVTQADGSLYVSYRTEKGVPPGSYKITVRHLTGRDGSPLPAGEEGAVIRESDGAIETIYEFERELAAGENTLVLNLQEGTQRQPEQFE